MSQSLPLAFYGSSMVVFLLSILLTGVYRRVALKQGILDIPNDRSSHQQATPRGGGVVILLLFVCAVVLFTLVNKTQLSSLWIYFPAIVLGGLGFVDDRAPLPVRLRMSVQVLCVVAVLALLTPLTDQVVMGLALSSALLTLIGFVYLLWLLNLYNFMDGIDGLAAVQTICVCSGIMLILPVADATALSSQIYHLLMVLLSATAGFLIWNWSPAKLFMGDVGSVFIGLLLGIVSLQTTVSGIISFWCWPILLAVFITDTSLTLLTRLLRREHIFQAHRQHYYQRLAMRMGHVKVVLVILLFNSLWLLPMAWFANRSADLALLYLFVAYLPLLIFAATFSKLSQKLTPPSF